MSSKTVTWLPSKSLLQVLYYIGKANVEDGKVNVQIYFSNVEDNQNKPQLENLIDEELSEDEGRLLREMGFSMFFIVIGKNCIIAPQTKVGYVIYWDR